MSATRRTGRGFTSVELMITLVIAGVFAALAYPGFIKTVRDTRLATTADLLTADVNLARREAIMRNGTVLVCPVSSTANTCGTDFTKWANGWMICYDLAADASCDTSTSTNPNPIAERGKLDPSLTLTGPTASVQFKANGTQGSSAVTFCVNGSWTGSKPFKISIPVSGAIAMSSVTTCP